MPINNNKVKTPWDSKIEEIRKKDEGSFERFALLQLYEAMQDGYKQGWDAKESRGENVPPPAKEPRCNCTYCEKDRRRSTSETTDEAMSVEKLARAMEVTGMHLNQYFNYVQGLLETKKKLYKTLHTIHERSLALWFTSTNLTKIGWQSCRLCSQIWRVGEPESHMTDCPFYDWKL